MKTYSMDLRRRVIAACDAGHDTTPVAQMFDVSPAWVRRLKQHRRQRGTIEPRRRGRRDPGMFDADHLAHLKAMVQRQPDATLEQMRERCRRELGVVCAVQTVWRALRKLGFSLKKRRFEPPSRTGRTWRVGGSTSASPHASRKSNASSSSTNRGPRRT